MDRYAVFGNPIAHSKSPLIHTAFAEQTGQAMAYTAQLSELDAFEADLDRFFSQQGRGCNVTVPFKERAYRYAGQLSQRAELAGAVNTLIKCDDGTIVGDNTDGYGLVLDLLSRGVPLADKRILIVGAGGAARGVMLPLLEQNPAAIVIVNRTAEKAQQLAQQFAKFGAVSASAFDGLAQLPQFDLIINSTSASLSGDLPPLPDTLIHAQLYCYDMAYGSTKTVFQCWAERLGCKASYDGLGMLVGQAAEAFRLWRGVLPSVEPVLQRLRSTV